MLLLSQAFVNEEPLSLYVLDCGSMYGMGSARFLSGDLFHSQLNRSLHAAPEVNVDREQRLESMRGIEEFVTAYDAQLWIQHDPWAESGGSLCFAIAGRVEKPCPALGLHRYNRRQLTTK